MRNFESIDPLILALRHRARLEDRERDEGGAMLGLMTHSVRGPLCIFSRQPYWLGSSGLGQLVTTKRRGPSHPHKDQRLVFLPV